MAIRMTGLMSGLDTESIIEQLMSAESMKKTKVENKKTKLEWQKEIWVDLNAKLKNLYNSFVSKMRLQTTYKTKKASSSNEALVTAKANSNAADGSYDIKVNHLASPQNVTSGKLPTTDAKGNKVSSSTKLEDLGISAGDSEITVTAGDKKVTLNVDSNTTIGDFISSLQSAGLHASYDETQNRIFISSNGSGKDNSFSLTSSTMSSEKAESFQQIKDSLHYDSLSSADKQKVNSALSALQNGTEEEKIAAKTTLQEIAENATITAATAYVRQSKTNELTDKYFETTTVTSEPDEDGETTETEVTKLTAEGEAALEAWYVEKYGQEKYDTLTEEDKVKAAQTMMSNQVADYMAEEDTKTAIADMVENGFTNDLGETPVVYDDAALLASKLDAAADAFAAGTSTENNSVLNKLGLSSFDGLSDIEEGSDSSGMVVVAAKDAEIVLNGATLTSSTNTVSVNGVEFELKGVTKGESITITVSNDTSAVYDTIKSFITEYNNVLKEMNTLYYADSAKDYDPLTSEQKDEMSDDEIEKWEKKIKDSLLRRDSTLDGLITSMKNAMMGSVTIDGKSYSLASLGIMTSTDYTEKGLLHIFGDETDATYADKDNKLQQLLDSDPDLVMQIMSGLASNLYSVMGKKMQASSLSSSQTFYNDKYIDDQLKNYEKDISKWEEKLKKIEDRYYNQFTAMEKALAQLQSQQSALAGLFGGSYY